MNRWRILPLIIKTLKIISVRCIPLSLGSKPRRRATLRTTSFSYRFLYDKRNCFNFYIKYFPFFSTFAYLWRIYLTAHTIRQSSSSYEYFTWGRCDFSESFSGREMSGNILNRLLCSYMVDTGILSNDMNPPESYMIFWSRDKSS